MTRSATPGSPARVTLVLGTVAGGTGTHAKMLVTGLLRRGIAVSVAGPSSANARFSFSSVASVPFSAVEIGDRPRASDLGTILRLRKLLLGPAGDRLSRGGGHVVHAHGLRAGALTALALSRAREGRPGVVVTVHNAPGGGGAARLVYLALERIVARSADLVLCVSPDLERRMRAAGARRVARAVIAAPADAPARGGPSSAAAAVGKPDRHVTALEPVGIPLPGIGPAGTEAAGRPVVLAAGRLTGQKGFGVLLEAADAWRDLAPMPLVVIAGDGPLAGKLRARADALGVAAVFLGHCDDVPARLAAAAVFVLPSLWEGQPLVLQEALRAGTPVVAARVGGIPDLTGEDAALLVPPGEARALGDAVRAVLTDPVLAARLREAAAKRATALPSEADAVTAALDAYTVAARGGGLR